MAPRAVKTNVIAQPNNSPGKEHMKDARVTVVMNALILQVILGWAASTPSKLVTVKAAEAIECSLRDVA